MIGMLEDDNLETAVKDCMNTNAAMQLTLPWLPEDVRANYCGNWDNKKNCPYIEKDRH